MRDRRPMEGRDGEFRQKHMSIGNFQQSFRGRVPAIESPISASGTIEMLHGLCALLCPLVK